MKAQILSKPAPVETYPLEWKDVPDPEPKPDELLIEVSTCGVCHTDLHVVEGELPDIALPIIPGHQIVGIVKTVGSAVTHIKPGARAGVPWLHFACGKCEYCLRGLENLCLYGRFTGYTAQGGYAERVTVPEAFAVQLPDSFSDVDAAPLLCSGIVGYRSVKLSDLKPGERLGLYGYGGSAGMCLQIARYWNCEVYVFTRNPQHQQEALKLGASWVGQAQDEPPLKLDRAIIFAPAGWIIPLALKHIRKAGTLCINAIHMSNLPEIPYSLFWDERTVRSVANASRQDATEFMDLAAQIPIRSDTHTFPLSDANRVLEMLKKSQISGSAVFTVR